MISVSHKLLLILVTNPFTIPGFDIILHYTAPVKNKSTSTLRSLELRYSTIRIPTKWVGVHIERYCSQVDYGFEHWRGGLSKIGEATLLMITTVPVPVELDGRKLPPVGGGGEALQVLGGKQGRHVQELFVHLCNKQ